MLAASTTYLGITYAVNLTFTLQVLAIFELPVLSHLHIPLKKGTTLPGEQTKGRVEMMSDPEEGEDAGKCGLLDPTWLLRLGTSFCYF